MSIVRDRGEQVRRFILENLADHAGDIVRVTADQFTCTRQAVHKHLQRLVAEGAVTESGQTRGKTYQLAPLVSWDRVFEVTPDLTEDAIWRDHVLPAIDQLPKNVLDIWHYGVTEMVNNVIDHSGATHINITLMKTAVTTLISIYDNGVGIFKKIKAAMGLVDERHAVLELAKGKFTTDPSKHSGEGIFFASRMFDVFEILSGHVMFSHQFNEREDWITQPRVGCGGTLVGMELNNHTARTARKVFGKYTSGDDFGFNKTIVPVRLMQYGDDNLVSRSQAKRLLARFDRFKVVMLDFAGVASIGQAFADEVFRVFRNHHPEVEIHAVNAAVDVKRMISRAEALDASAVLTKES
jgi:anti-sigma regulatory factor (Ser/Thr protein kinase)